MVSNIDDIMLQFQMPYDSKFILHTRVFCLPLLIGRCHTGIVGLFDLPPHTELCGTGTVSRNLQSTYIISKASNLLWYLYNYIKHRLEKLTNVIHLKLC